MPDVFPIPDPPRFPPIGPRVGGPAGRRAPPRAGMRGSARARRAASDAARRKALNEASRIRLPPGLGVLGRILGAGATAIEATRIVIDAINKKQQSEFDDEAEAQTRSIREKIRKRNRDKKLRTIGMSSPAGGPGVPSESVVSGQVKDVLPLPSTRPVEAKIELPKPDFGGVFGQPAQLPRSPDIAPAGPIGEPRLPEVADPLPQTPTAPSQAPKPSKKPAVAPIPGFGVPGPAGVPGSNPFALPGQFPFGNPLTVGQPATSPVNFIQPGGAPGTAVGDLTGFQQGVIELPQPSPFAQTNPNCRCKPCKEDNPKPRSKCFKGFYKEGRLDNDIDLTRWAEINCETGVELDKRSQLDNVIEVEF